MTSGGHILGRRAQMVARYRIYKFKEDGRQIVIARNIYINPFAPGDFAEKRVLKLVEWFSGHCRAIKS